MKRLAALAVAASLVIAPAAIDHAVKSPAKFKTCKALQAKHKNGVGLNNATDHTSGKTQPVTNFKKDYRLYLANSARDGDKDGVACEKKGVPVKKPTPAPTTTIPAPPTTTTPAPVPYVTVWPRH